jgi:hypothetical protein
VWEGSKLRKISAATHHHAVKVNIFEGLTVSGTAE